MAFPFILRATAVRGWDRVWPCGSLTLVNIAQWSARLFIGEQSQQTAGRGPAGL